MREFIWFIRWRFVRRFYLNFTNYCNCCFDYNRCARCNVDVSENSFFIGMTNVTLMCSRFAPICKSQLVVNQIKCAIGKACTLSSVNINIEMPTLSLCRTSKSKQNIKNHAKKTKEHCNCIAESEILASALE